MEFNDRASPISHFSGIVRVAFCSELLHTIQLDGFRAQLKSMENHVVCTLTIECTHAANVQKLPINKLRTEYHQNPWYSYKVMFMCGRYVYYTVLYLVPLVFSAVSSSTLRKFSTPSSS